MSSNSRSLIFATVLCVVCSLLLTAAATGLKSFQQRNIAVDRYKNILVAFGLLDDGDALPADRIEQMYQTNVRQVRVDAQGRVAGQGLPLYLHVEEKSVRAYAVPIESRGLWGAIHGYLAIEQDGVTVKGFTVDQHQETPGLGGEIDSRGFRRNFEGKKILDPEGNFVSVRIAKGRAADAVPQTERINYVDGISGATLTGQFLTTGLRDTLARYEPVAERFRSGEANDFIDDM